MRDTDGDISKVDTAYTKLKDLVIHYDLVPDSKVRVLPGEHLHIDDLADRVNASATPVRQALERLQGEGLIDSIAKRGFFSKVPNASELQDLYEFARLVLEHNITRPLDPSSVARLGRGLMKVEAVAVGHSAAKCVKHHAITIESVFEQITQMSRNEQMARMMRNFNDRSRYVRCLSILQSPDQGAQVRECLELIEALRDQDPRGACAKLETHMGRMIVDLPELIRDARSRWTMAAAM
jgi:DNA-binding GntR family transcriptional regulator